MAMATQITVETMDAWGEVTSRSIAATPPPSYSVDTPPMTPQEPPLPTRGHKAAIAELGLRFPCPRDTDPDEYAARQDYLAKDCAHISVALLRAACDRAAQSAKGMPYASEILANAAQIVEERQRAIDASAAPNMRVVPGGSREEEYRQINRDYANRGSNFRMTMDGSLFRIGDPGEKRSTNYNGEVAS